MSEKAVRKHYAELAQYVDLANLLMPGTEWPSAVAMDEYAGLVAQLSSAVQGRAPADFIKAMNAEAQAAELHDKVLEPVWRAACKRFSKVPSAIRAQGMSDIVVFEREVPKGDPSIPRYFTFIDRLRLYDAAWWAREALRKIAGAAPGSQPTDLSLPVETTRIQVMPDGTMLTRLDFFRDFFLPALSGKSVRRIKVCPVSELGCGRLFVAFRKDQVACSAACANRVRVKGFRTENPEYYTAQSRRARRAQAEKAAEAAARKQKPRTSVR